MKNILLLSLTIPFLISCAQTNRSSYNDGAPIDSEIKADDMVSSSEYGEIKLVINRPVLKWINYFQGRGRKHMQRYLERSSRYLPMMKEELRKEGLPEDLIYVPMIESGFSATAHSHASAVGYWQFIRGTGKRYGLTINSYMDERRDPVLSTKAAAAYFKALYNLFGDWYLALASYNTGENRVKRAVMRHKTRNFWKLAKKRSIPRETRNYVPKYLAAMVISKNPQKYGFTNLEYKPRLSYDTVAIFKPISLDKLAKNMGQQYKTLKALNPKYRSDYVPVKGSVEIRVPRGTGRLAVAKMDASVSSAPKIIPQDYFWYRVRRGDTLSEIAQRNRTRVSTIRRLNRLGRRSFIRVGQRLRVPDRGMSQLRAKKRAAKRKTYARSNKNAEFHTVRRGENLSVIASRYGVSVAQLKNLNRLGRRSMIRVGQKIKIKETAARERVPSSRVNKRTKYHTVKSGENLSLIARKYGANLRQLKNWNSLGRQSVITPGQKLRVKAPVSYHTVKSGENLSLIAKKYSTSVSKIARANSLKKRSVLYAGKKLVIPE